MKRLEMIILKNLLKSEPFLRKALPYLKNEYFNESRAEQIIFEEIAKHVDKYKFAPSLEALSIAISHRTNVFESDMVTIDDYIDQITKDQVVTTESDIQALSDVTEKFCQEKALYNAIHESIQIMADKTNKKDKGSIPQLLTDALAVTFDPNVGHDYIEDSDKRFEYYHRASAKFPFLNDKFNAATGGGLEPKTLNVILAGPKVGKSLIMCDWAAGYLSQGYNVLYITMEMAEEKISQRIDANLLDITIDTLKALSKASYDEKIAAMKEQVKGRLIVKEYPTATPNVNHFRGLLNELLLKKQFRPHVIIVDYLNLCTSSRLKNNGNVNSYTLIKSIAEELRGLACEHKLPLISATQLTRSGSKNSDPEMDDTSESFGLPMTVDEFWVVTTNDQLRAINQLSVKKLASRSTDVNDNRRFVVGVNYAKMKLYNVDESGQNLIQEATQLMSDPVIGGNQRWDKFRSVITTLEGQNIDIETGEIT